MPRASLAEVAERLTAAGAAPVGSWAYEAVRVEARRPRLGFETDHRTIPHEVGWIGTAVHLDKGCYRGQETVARVHNLGRPPRRLVLLHLSGERDELPPRRAPRCCSTAARSASSAPPSTTTSSARSRSAWSSAPSPTVRSWTPRAPPRPSTGPTERSSACGGGSSGPGGSPGRS